MEVVEVVEVVELLELLELLDQNVTPGEVVNTADLYVVIPASLELSCLSHNS